MTGPRVLVIGDVMRDVVVRPRGAVRPGTDQWASIAMLPGGSGANQAAWLARFGVSVRLLACVGRDDRDAEAARLRDIGVEPVLAAHPDRPTGTLVALIDASGERTFLTDRGANDGLRRADLPVGLLDGVAHLHLSGYSLWGEATRATVLDLLAEARSAGRTVSIDPGSAGLLADLGVERVLGWIGRAALCILNAGEATVLTGSSDPQEQARRLAGRFDVAVVKCGPEAALAAVAGGACFSAVPPRVAVVDTIGAGDAFGAAYLARWLGNEPVQACLDAAVRAGSAAVTRAGGRPDAAP